MSFTQKQILKLYFEQMFEFIIKNPKLWSFGWYYTLVSLKLHVLWLLKRAVGHGNYLVEIERDPKFKKIYLIVQDAQDDALYRWLMLPTKK